MAERLEGTGVLLILADEMPADDLAEAWPERLRERLAGTWRERGETR